jgi:hypothetical protein
MNIKDALKKLCDMAGNSNVSEETLDDMAHKLSMPSPSSYKLYGSYPEMIEDIRAYTKVNGGNIEENNEPMVLRLGFKHIETGQQWRLPLARAKRGQLNNDEGEAKINFLKENDLLYKYINNQISDEDINKLLMLK